MAQYILGVSGFFHDSAAALVKDGVPIAAAQEERFTRKRHDSSFPANAIEFCLRYADITMQDLDCVAYYEDSELKFQRIISSFKSAGPSGFKSFMKVFPDWSSWKRNMEPFLAEELGKLQLGPVPKIVCGQHHRSHAASAFFPSPFQSSTVLCVDGVGEFDTTSIWHGDGSQLDYVNSISYPHSLGLLYSAFTYYCGFKVDSGEYKLMGLAPYGEPKFAQKIRDELINIRSDGSFSLNMKYFEFLQGERMLGNRFETLFGGKIRAPESSITQRECDLAASVQKVTEEAVLSLAKFAINATARRKICLAGGVALNCVANGALSRSGLVKDMWIQPAAGDAGCALGVALDQAFPEATRPHVATRSDAMQGALLGPQFTDDQITAFLNEKSYPYRKLTAKDVTTATAQNLSEGKVVGWFQDRMEFGPRALGARSILGDARNIEMQKKLNLKIKFRESFRPFAPAVLAEDVSEYFETNQASPYMLIVSGVKDNIRVKGASSTGLGDINSVRSSLPAITHVDYSARVQTVTEANNVRFYNLLKEFKKMTGCSVLVNTSFNVRGEPIVLSPGDAYTCFMRTNMDVLVLGNCLLMKEDQPKLDETQDWREEIPLD